MSVAKLFHLPAIPLFLKVSSLLLVLSACTDVPAPNLPPPISLDSFGANPDPSPVNVGTTFSWSLSGTNLTCQLDTNLDGTAEYTLPNCTSQDRVSHQYSQPGTYSARLTVLAPNLSPLEKTLSLQVLEANLEPEVLRFEEGEGTTPTSLEFSWTVSDPSSDVLQCRLDANGDGQWDYDQVCNTPQPGVGSNSTWQGGFTFDYGREDEFDAVFEVADNYSRKRKTRRVKTPYNRAPVIDGFSTRVVSAEGLKGSISAVVSDRDKRDSVTCTLQVESMGTFHYKNCSRIIRTYQFAAPGSYEVTLSATDGKATTTQKSTLVFDSAPPPVPVGVKQIVAGVTHTCVLTSAPTNAKQPPEGTALCWGLGHLGQLGTSELSGEINSPNDSAYSAVPVKVPAGTTFSSLAAGYEHTCALTSAGKAYCWGSNSSGQLGDGTTTNRFEAVAVLGSLTFTQISAGYKHTCGIAGPGNVYCWGSDLGGSLGNDPGIADSYTPVAIDADTVIGYTFNQVYAGPGSTCALSTSNDRFCWGTNGLGQLGLGVTNFSYAVPTKALTTGYKHMSFFVDGGCALTLSTPTGVCWGNQDYGGKLGDDGVSTGVIYTPTSVAYAEADLPARMATSLGANEHSCFLTAAGKAWCWGKGTSGRVGDGNDNFNNKKPVAVAGDTGVLIDIATGDRHTCAVSSGFKAYCWGNNAEAQLGLGEAELSVNKSVPTLVPVTYRAP